MRRSKTRVDFKRELISSNDDKRSKSRLTNKSNLSRNIKSAPTIQRSKSQIVSNTKRKEKPANSSRPVVTPVYKSMLFCLFIFVVLFLFCSNEKISNKNINSFCCFFSRSSEINYYVNWKIIFDIRYKSNFFNVVSIQLH